MEHDTESNLSGAPYTFYSHEETQYTSMPYSQPHLPYQVVPNAQAPEMLGMRQLSIMPHQGYQSQGNVYPGSSGSIPPVSPTQVAAAMRLPPSPSPGQESVSYDHPISPPISGSDTSNDGHAHYQHSYSRESSSGAASPPSGIRGNTLVHRTQHRYHPTAAAQQRPTRRRRSSTNDEHEFSDDGEGDGGSMGISPQSTGGYSGQHLAESLANSRKEATRRQRIEAEQRRRDELREGYAKLKDVLPVSNQKSSKVSLLERATNYISNLDQSSKILHVRLATLEAEVARLREINERLSLTVAHHTGHMPTDIELGLPPPEHMIEQNLDRPLSPPPDIHPAPPPHVSQPPQQHQQQHEAMYHQRTDSSASGSQASGSEY